MYTTYVVQNDLGKITEIAYALEMHEAVARFEELEANHWSDILADTHRVVLSVSLNGPEG